jgi:hypothetical protein
MRWLVKSKVLMLSKAHEASYWCMLPNHNGPINWWLTFKCIVDTEHCIAEYTNILSGEF